MRKLISGSKAMKVSPRAMDPTKWKCLGRKDKVKRKVGFKEMKIEAPLTSSQVVGHC